jgi:nucleoid-associated protein YgaU
MKNRYESRIARDKQAAAADAAERDDIDDMDDTDEKSNTTDNDVRRRPRSLWSTIIPIGDKVMGKEAKIGLGVILILLVVFGIVLARKLSPAVDNGPAASQDAKGTPPGTKPEGTAGVDAGPKSSGPSTRPTIVEARPGSSRLARQSSLADGGQWNVVSDGGGSRPGRSGSVPPSYMDSRAGGGSSSPPYDPYTAARPAGKTASSWSSGEAGASDSGAAMPPRPLNPTRQPGTYDSSDPSAPAGGANPLRGASSGTSSADQGAAAPRYAGSSVAATGSGAYGTGTASTYLQTDASQPAAPTYTAADRSPLKASPEPAPLAAPYAQPVTPYGTSASTSAAPIAAPIGATAPAAQPIAGDPRRPDGTYVVKPGDTYWAISEKLYGTGAYFKALAEHNRKRHPREDQLKVDDVIAAPARAELEQNYAHLCPKPIHVDAARRQALAVNTAASQYGTGKTYVVQEGDSLFDIARFELGKPARWTEIYELNREVLGGDPDHLRPGTRLSLPTGESSDVLTRRPGSAFQR